MHQDQLIPHLFRTEFRKITSVLCKSFGTGFLEAAEDIAGDTFLSALEQWPYKGIPAQPVAWLYAVAKNKALNYLKRKQVFSGKISPDLKKDSPGKTEPDIDLSERNISDSQLEMMFAICHPSIPAESQIALCLRILCGFGIEEIANALLSNKETINKKLFRAKEKLRSENPRLEMPAGEEVNKRLAPVLTTLYLLFSEGYYSETNEDILRENLCLEAMQLCNLLLENQATNQPDVNALLSLMCFHASRFPARKNERGEMVLYQDQDESRWNQQLIAEGIYFLKQGSRGDTISKYHLEAGIAYWHTIIADTKEKWENILQLYNRLLQLRYSPVAALNRTYALSKANGKEEAIKEAEKLQLTTNHYYFYLLGELYSGIDNVKAKENFVKAFALAKTKADKLTIEKKLDQL